MNAGYVAVAGWLAGKAKGANLCCELDIVIVRQCTRRRCLLRLNRQRLAVQGRRQAVVRLRHTRVEQMQPPQQHTCLVQLRRRVCSLRPATVQQQHREVG